MNDHPSDWVQFALVAVGLTLFFAVLSLPMIVWWRKMARLYPDGPFTAKHTWYSVSGSLGQPTARGYSHHLAVGKEGLRLFAILPLRWPCPPILVPWDAIHLLQGKPSSFGCDSLCIEISGVPVALCFSFLWRHGKAISVIQQYREERRSDPRNGLVSQSESNPIVPNRI